MQSIEFPFRPFRHPLFGMQYRPYALIILQNDSYFFQEYFLVDSGADVTVLPYASGLQLGFRAQLDELVYTLGGGSVGLPVVYRTIQLRVGPHKIDCRVAWALSDKAPAILGRLDVFEQFYVEFREPEHRTLFTRV